MSERGSGRGWFGRRDSSRTAVRLEDEERPNDSATGRRGSVNSWGGGRRGSAEVATISAVDPNLDFFTDAPDYLKHVDKFNYE
ncbi:hypothetical protein E3N88_37302 [Mikania micrantha]|uniref:Uncharacterized protein n=1 Tax=Mikania micrantha TaxID=192012 RepID=A0A5N6LRN3_9ASTR|nr:hypothetical protein E3N88_37302 [Mikania micrantha]